MSNYYTYFIGWSDQQRGYYGARYGKGCHPSDLWKTYFTSSKQVMKFREQYGEPDIIEVRRIFPTARQARLWESKVLDRINAASHPKLLNRRNGSWKWALYEKTPEDIEKTAAKLRGRKQSKDHIENSRKARIGLKHTTEHNHKISESGRGIPQPASFGPKISNKIWINDGKHHKRLDKNLSIPLGWQVGRIKNWISPSPKIVAVNTMTNCEFHLSRDEFCKMNNYKTSNIPAIKGKVKYKYWILQPD